MVEPIRSAVCEPGLDLINQHIRKIVLPGKVQLPILKLKAGARAARPARIIGPAASTTDARCA
jgi:hypothetical protein